MSTATFVLPPKSRVGILDPSIAGEGEPVYGADGETMNWTPPPEKLVVPDLSQVKSLRKYFGRSNFPIFPAWLYHPAEPARVVRTAQEAAELGVCYRATSHDEQMRYGKKFVWDWKDDAPWRPTPYEANSKRPAAEQGKELIIKPPNPTIAQHELVKALIPEVAAAVAKAMKGAPGPANVSPDDWKEFQEFLAWKKSAESIEAVARRDDYADPDPLGPPSNANALSALGMTEIEEKDLLIEEAKSRGLHFDRRSSIAKIKEAIEKAAAA
jgi:hypothetical protein